MKIMIILMFHKGFDFKKFAGFIISKSFKIYLSTELIYEDSVHILLCFISLLRLPGQLRANSTISPLFFSFSCSKA